MVLPGQVRRYLENTAAKEEAPRERDWKFAKQLVRRHIDDHPFERLPDYSFDRLRKGVNCPRCMSMMHRATSRSVACGHCGSVLTNDKALGFNIRQLQYLFPELELSASLVFQWCGGMMSRRIIRYVLDLRQSK